MMCEDGIKLKGEVKIIATDPKTGRVVKTVENHNTIMDVGEKLIANVLIDSPDYDAGVTECGWGTSNASTHDGMTGLTNQYKKAITKREVKQYADAGYYKYKIETSTFFRAEDATADIEEVGLFGTSNGTVLISRALLQCGNSGESPSDITIYWKITIG